VNNHNPSDYPINVLRNCGIINSIFSIDDASKLNIDDFENWSRKVINDLPNGSPFIKMCQDSFLKLMKWKLSSEFHDSNNTIDSEMINKINEFLFLIETA